VFAARAMLAWKSCKIMAVSTASDKVAFISQQEPHSLERPQPEPLTAVSPAECSELEPTAVPMSLTSASAVSRWLAFVHKLVGNIDFRPTIGGIGLRIR
jgi:hypothetical protein